MDGTKLATALMNAIAAPTYDKTSKVIGGLSLCHNETRYKTKGKNFKKPIKAMPLSIAQKVEMP